MTGRGMGPCGWGLRRGGRGAWCCPFYGPKLTKEEERAVLEDEVKDLGEELKAAQERLAELQS